MLRSVFRPTDGPLRYDLDLNQMRQALEAGEGLLWVSLEQAGTEEIDAVLGGIFRFHTLTIEDCRSRSYQSPKVDIFDAYLFLVVHGLRPDFPLDRLDTRELDIFLGTHYVVTSHQAAEMPPLDALWRRLDLDERLTRRGADFLCYAILDELVDEFLPLLDQLDEQLDGLGDQAVLGKPSQDLLEQVLALKHGIATLRRVTAPQREVLNRLSRDDLSLIQPRHRIYYRDVYDHLVRVHDLSDAIRDVATGTLETYLSATSNRLNEVMKALTIVSTIFLPLSFLAGVYGMNFDHMPELRWQFGYFAVWGLFIVIVLGMLGYFRHRGWL